MSASVIVVTGASSGIGAATARQLSGEGHRVVLVARRGDALQQVAQSCAGPTLTIVADMSIRDDAERVAASTIAQAGRIDVWVNNVGRGITRMPSALTADAIQRMMDVNVLTALYGMQAVLPHFRGRGTGHIINVSSMLGRLPYALPRSAYTAAKHFLNALTIMMRDDVQATHPGIQLTLVSPGVVYTDFGLNAEHGGADSRSFPGGQTPEEIARVISQAITTRVPDLYTRAGAAAQVADYYARLGADPA
jgi:NADP-dependent 3-hydroxy acid dehydrogenase YdfG